MPAVVVEQHVRDRRRIRRVAAAQIEIRKTIVIHIAEVQTHRHEDAFEARFGRHIAKLAIPQIMK